MKVSVCIATYNGEKYIKEQLDSILSQLAIGDEIIISDDSSTDSTLTIIDNYRDSRIKIYANQVFRNPIFNFENALKKASGDVIFLSDQDDIWNVQKKEIMLAELDNVDLVLSDFVLIDSQSKLIKDYNKKDRSHVFFPYNLIHTPFMGCCMAFKRKVLLKSLPFPKLIPMHDMWLGLIASLFFKVKYVDNELLFRRIHGYNVSFEDGKSTNSIFRKIKIRFTLIEVFIKFILKI